MCLDLFYFFEQRQDPAGPLNFIRYSRKVQQYKQQDPQLNRHYNKVPRICKDDPKDKKRNAIGSKLHRSDANLTGARDETT